MKSPRLLVSTFVLCILTVPRVFGDNDVLIALWSQVTNPRNLEVDCEKAVAGISDGQAKNDGLAWGKYVAETVLPKRAKSGFNHPIPGQYSSSEPGTRRETPPGFRPPCCRPEVLSLRT